MNTRDQLNQYLHGLEKRMRWLAVSRGAAVAAGVALGATLALVLITNALAFSSTSMTVARKLLSLNFRNAFSPTWNAARIVIPCWICWPWTPCR